MHFSFFKSIEFTSKVKSLRPLQGLGLALRLGRQPLVWPPGHLRGRSFSGSLTQTQLSRALVAGQSRRPVVLPEAGHRARAAASQGGEAGSPGKLHTFHDYRLFQGSLCQKLSSSGLKSKHFSTRMAFLSASALRARTRKETKLPASPGQFRSRAESFVHTNSFGS